MHKNRKQLSINNKKMLKKLYFDDGLSVKKIAQLLKCSSGTVVSRMREHSIKGRDFTTLGLVPWNKGLKVGFTWNKGLKGVNKSWRKGLVFGPMPKEIRLKISQANKGKKMSEEAKKKMSIAHLKIKGGISSEDRLQRIKFRRDIQKKVLERDNYACVIGGKKHGSNLQVDHIQSWADYVELRFNIDNCRTLCMTCHYQITFGKPMPPTVRAWGQNLKEVIKNSTIY